MKPYGLMADVHAHNWSAFATVEGEINTRLAGLIAEIRRCAEEVKARGGDKIIIAGDMFHVRGSIAPTVLNPINALMWELHHEDRINICLLAGNHDLEGKHSSRMTSAITSLASTGCATINTVMAGKAMLDDVVMVPWIESLDELMATIDGLAKDCAGHIHKTDLVLHAPIDGAIPGLPARGLDPNWLCSRGFKRVFAGHYHNHKDFGNTVYSIGALAHHTWSDVGTKAGFLIVGEDFVEWRKSHLPEFVDIHADTEPEEVPLLVEGNYVRAKINYGAKVKDINALRDELTKYGAKGIVVQSLPAPPREREDSKVADTVRAGGSLESAVSEFVKSSGFENQTKVMAEVQDVLAHAAMVEEE